MVMVNNETLQNIVLLLWLLLDMFLGLGDQTSEKRTEKCFAFLLRKPEDTFHRKQN